MNDEQQELRCLACGRGETAVPLLAVRFEGEGHWICAGCMPVLIHKTDQLVEAVRRQREAGQP